MASQILAVFFEVSYRAGTSARAPVSSSRIESNLPVLSTSHNSNNFFKANSTAYRLITCLSTRISILASLSTPSKQNFSLLHETTVADTVEHEAAVETCSQFPQNKYNSTLTELSALSICLTGLIHSLKKNGHRNGIVALCRLELHAKDAKVLWSKCFSRVTDLLEKQFLKEVYGQSLDKDNKIKAGDLNDHSVVQSCFAVEKSKGKGHKIQGTTSQEEKLFESLVWKLDSIMCFESVVDLLYEAFLTEEQVNAEGEIEISSTGRPSAILNWMDKKMWVSAAFRFLEMCMVGCDRLAEVTEEDRIRRLQVWAISAAHISCRCFKVLPQMESKFSCDGQFVDNSISRLFASKEQIKEQISKGLRRDRFSYTERLVGLIESISVLLEGFKKPKPILSPFSSGQC